MTNTEIFAKNELDILSETIPDSVIIPFKKEILSLCNTFGKSGQSGGSAPFTASALSDVIKNLLLQKPITDITGEDKEWIDISSMNNGEKLYQNSRCYGLFKYSNGKCSYNDAIIWQGENDWDTFTGKVYLDDENFEIIGSSQYVKFPFKPKSFYVDVIRVPITKEEAKIKNIFYIEDSFNNCYYTILKNPEQLNEVFNYYEKK